MSLRERKKAQTLQAILDAAQKLFGERGYEATRTRDIAAEAGVATGTLFNYAKTKEDVVLQLWKRHANTAMEIGLRQAERESDPVEAVVAVFRPIFAFYAADLELGRIFLQQAIYARSADDPELQGLNEGFIARLSLLVGPHAGLGAMHAAMNVFGAYYLVLTMLLAGRLHTTDQAEQLLRGLVQQQRRGWT